MTTVCLVQMPFGAIERPSIALGILKSALVAEGHRLKVDYANILFAEMIGLRNYCFYSYSMLVGEWFFKSAAFRSTEQDYADFIERTGSLTAGTMNTAVVQRIRDAVDPFLDRVTQRILADNPKIVGCSSVLQQHIPSLALLRRIREQAPDVVTMLGGANCDGVMGMATHRNFEWVDYVVAGEADTILPELCRIIENKGRDAGSAELPTGVLAPIHRETGYQGIRLTRGLLENMDKAHTPDYGDYFETLEGSAIGTSIQPTLVFESSRGCWWGHKNQCSFCGINNTLMKYRSKKAEHVLDEWQKLSTRYGVKTLQTTDLVIPSEYFNTLLPRLAETKPGYSLLYETRTHISRDQVKRMADAGVVLIQPGIESLHDQLLKKLNKGVTACMNIRLLKWAMEFGIACAWNILCDLPDDEKHWYEEMAELIPLLVHLQAPLNSNNGLTPIRYDRFSVYFANQEKYGLNLKPFPHYREMYPLADSECAELAYYFEQEGGETRKLPEGRLPVEMRKWHQATFERVNDFPNLRVRPSRAVLEMVEQDDSLSIKDTRPCAVAYQTILTGLQRDIYLYCDGGHAGDHICNHFEAEKGKYEVHSILEELIAKKLMVQVSGRYLSLAVRPPQRPLTLRAEVMGQIFFDPEKNPCSG